MASPRPAACSASPPRWTRSSGHPQLSSPYSPRRDRRGAHHGAAAAAAGAGAPFVPADGDELLVADQRHRGRLGFGPWAVVERERCDFVGRVGLQWTDVGGQAGIEVLWTIDPNRHGEGLVTEAATAALGLAAELELEETFAMVPPTNAASLRVADKLGLSRAGQVAHVDLDHVLFRTSPGPATAI